MRLIKPSFEIIKVMALDENDYVELLFPDLGPLKHIEVCGRTCYKSEERITAGSAEKFVRDRLGGHESVIEHSAMTVRFICDRGVSHELVRHRLCAFSQESTRYCNYKGRLTFIIPPWIDIEEGEYVYEDGKKYLGINNTTYIWIMNMLYSANDYEELLNNGWTPQQARSVLPNSLKTEIVVTANFREWRHIFKLRCAPAAHPQMREIMIPLHKECKELIPVIFDDIICPDKEVRKEF